MINRRTLIKGGAGLAALAVSPGLLARNVPAPGVYARSIAIDTLSFDEPSIDVGAAIAAGLTAVVLDIRAEPRDTTHADAALDKWNAAFAAPDSRYLRILKAADLAEAKRLGKLGIVLNCQNATILGPPIYSNTNQNIDLLRHFHGRGLRVLQLVYTNSNGLGTGYSENYDAGLTRLGIAVVEEMNHLGMLVDTSHASEATCLDAIARSTRPTAITHAGCLSLYPDKRNKSDALIRALAEKGGYFGIYNMTMWMTTNPTATVETIVDHVDHAVKVGGIDLVGFGSDHPVLGDPRPQPEKVKEMQNFIGRNRGWPGGEPTVGHVTASDMDGPDRLHVLADALARRSYKDAAIEKILGGNFVRVFGAACA